MHAAERAILVEGNVDVVKLHQWELEETVAPLGTALTEDQAKLLGRFTKKVVLCFDGDSAGKKAAWKALPLLMAQDLDVRMVLLPEGQDPDSLGRDRLVALLENPKSALVEMMMRIANRAGDGLDARAQGLDRIIPLISSAPRPSARELYANAAAELFRLPLQQIAAKLRTYMNRPRESSRSRPGHPRDFHSTSGAPVPVSAAMASVTPLPDSQAELAMLLVDLPHLASVARRSGALAFVTDARLAPIVGAVVDGAEAGRTPAMPELLALVPEAEQRQIHDVILSGRYRGDGEPDDPKGVLDELVHRCREETLDAEIRRLEIESASATRAGDVDRARQLQLDKLALRRQQAALRSGIPIAETPIPPEDPSEHFAAVADHGDA